MHDVVLCPDQRRERRRSPIASSWRYVFAMAACVRVRTTCGLESLPLPWRNATEVHKGRGGENEAKTAANPVRPWPSGPSAIASAPEKERKEVQQLYLLLLLLLFLLPTPWAIAAKSLHVGGGGGGWRAPSPPSPRRRQATS